MVREPKPLTLSELGEIDGLSFNRAGTILYEARKYRDAFDNDLAVRRAQEALELFLKSIFRFLQVAYPPSHDVKKEIYEMTEALKEYRIEKRQIAKLVLGNSTLHLWRSAAFYGDEKLSVGGLFDPDEAKLALTYAELGQLICGIVRGETYRRAAARNTPSV